MMNRGKLEEWAVRLHMLRNRNRIQKAYKEEAQRIAKVQVTKLTEQTLIDRIEAYLIALEVM